MSLCKLEKIRILEVARFEYDRIMNSNDTDQIDIEEASRRINTLEALEKTESLFAAIEKELEEC